MSVRIGSTSPIRDRSVAAALTAVLAFALLAVPACSAADDQPTATPASAAAPTTAASVASTTTAATTTTTTTTVPAGPPLSDRLELVEVSVRLDEPAAPEQIVSISADTDTLADVSDEGVDTTPAWCSSVLEPAGSTFVVRVGPPAVSTATGGIERFELVAERAADASPSDATFIVVVDDATIEATGELRVLDEAARSGTFSGSAPDGTTVEGAFRCA